MPRRVVITGLGPVSALGVGVEANWAAVRAGRGALGPIAAFDPAGFPCRIAGEVKDFKVSSFVPKSYRKAVKVMARDIELAVAAADLAARDAGLVTKGTAEAGGAAPDEGKTTYDPRRVGAHVGAGLIAAELNELTDALAHARDEGGAFDIHRWGREGMAQLTPLWLLKYLPNMLACHVTIIHDAQGPSNTITCGEASAGLSIGESLRVIQRGAADACFCGGAESKINPMAFLRQVMTGRLTRDANGEEAARAVRPFCQTARGTAIGEGGGIVVLEALETFEKRGGAVGEAGRADTDRRVRPRAYAEVVGFGASQSVHRESRNLKPEPSGRGIALAIRAALREAGVGPEEIDLIVPFGLGWPESDRAEAAALQGVFGESLSAVPVASIKSMMGSCGAGAAGLDVCVAALALAEQTLPAVINCAQPLPGLRAGSAASRPAPLRHALVYTSSLGGQNAALVLRRLAQAS